MYKEGGGGKKGKFEQDLPLDFCLYQVNKFCSWAGEGVSGIKRNKSAKVQLSERGWRAFKIV